MSDKCQWCAYIMLQHYDTGDTGMMSLKDEHQETSTAVKICI